MIGQILLGLGIMALLIGLWIWVKDSVEVKVRDMTPEEKEIRDRHYEGL
jgi:hypothetical protein